MLLVYITIVIILIFFFINNNFLSVSSLRGIMQSMALMGIIAVGTACLLIGGGIDLTANFMCLFAGVICAMMIKGGVPWFAALVISVAIGAVIGAINAFLVSKLHMMPFIATIGVGSVMAGVTQAATNLQNVDVPMASFWWGSNSLFNVFPIPFIIMAILLILYGLMLSKTQFGRNIYLVGGNELAARLAGVNPSKTRTILYINSGALSALAGVVLASRMHTASPQSQSDPLMSAITAAIIGGVAFTGGAGGMLGCFIGLILLNFFNAGLSSLALDSYWTITASGLLLIIALAVDFLNERSRLKALMMKVKPTLVLGTEDGI